MELIPEIFISENHTKTNLAQIIQQSNIDILQPYALTKTKLLQRLSVFLCKCEYEIKFYDPSYPFCNKEEFIIYLGDNPQKLNATEKRLVQAVARKIIAFCKSGYDFNKSTYNEIEEVYQDCLKIKEHGDIFCVRNAITLFNITRDNNNQLECKVSGIIHNKLQLKNQYKKNCVPSLQVKHGNFKVPFD